MATSASPEPVRPGLRPGDNLPWTPALVLLMAGLMVSLLVAAMDSTVVGTALPTIARELGGFSLYSWVFTGYLLTSTTSVPLWGRLADIVGRRTILLLGLAVFVGGSVLCGLSPSMPFLIAFRVLQGIGAGCVQPLVFTIVGDTFPIGQRARLQAFFSGMWAIASVVGPILGAVFVSTIGWRWIFDINLPIGIAATVMIWGYREPKRRTADRSLDLVGALLLTLAIAGLLLGLGAGSATAKPNWPIAAGGAALMVVFVLYETRARVPVVPLDLLRNRVVGPALGAAIIAGTLMFGVTAYVPLFVQDGLGQSPFAAGAAAAPLSLGWPIGAVLAGRLLLRVGYERLLLAGSIALVVGTTLLAGFSRTPLEIGGSAAVMGLGMGLLSTPVLIVIQSSVEHDRRGAATALNQLARTVGGAVGVGLMGILIEGRHTALALQTGIVAVFWVMVAVAAAAFLLCGGILVTRRRPASA
ncbi:MAG: MDR family MFS transporter [Candidatus Dormiibacterota bacterium]